MTIETGYVYILSNPGLMEGTYKIGATLHDPVLRVAQLSASTGIPTPFQLVYFRRVQRPFLVESMLHSAFAAYRVNDSREFFKMPLAEIINEIEHFEAVPDDVSDNVETPWAELFASFPDDGTPRELDESERKLCADLGRKLKTRG